MSGERIERSFFGPAGEGVSIADVDVKLRHAPRWVLDSVARHRRAALPPVASYEPPTRRFIGWLAGTLAPGISTPCLSIEGDRLPEQLTFDCHRSMVQQGHRSDSHIDLRLGHDGEPIVHAPTNLTLRLHKHPLLGGCFEARLPEGEASERILDAIGDGGCGVSIGYIGKRQWRVERQERVRVVDEMRLHHIALILEGGPKAACYPAARAFAARSTGLGCPTRLREAAELFAWETIKRQHGLGG